jgi:hypothetical protein
MSQVRRILVTGRLVLGWEPSILLRQSLALTYPWIE